MQQSLYRACKNRYKAAASGVEDVGGYNISFEYYTQDDIDANVDAIARGEATKCTFGDSDQSKVVLVVGDTITIPTGFNLTPVSPKKSLVIFCNKFVNNGTVSMTAKGPNVEPHAYLLLKESDSYGGASDIIIPAYANNAVARAKRTNGNGANGNNGTNRQCGSGGQGSTQSGGDNIALGASGSGSAFAGGGGSGGVAYAGTSADVNTTYPMRGGNAGTGNYACGGGVGNPVGTNKTSGTGGGHTITNNSGVGGRVIIYCVEFENNGTISANGVATKQTANMSTYPNADQSWGGASGGGAVDVFYKTLTLQGTITATGGSTFTKKTTPGKGGNGSTTLLSWNFNRIVKTERKMFSEENWLYLFNNYAERLKDDEAL